VDHPGLPPVVPSRSELRCFVRAAETPGLGDKAVQPRKARSSEVLPLRLGILRSLPARAWPAGRYRGNVDPKEIVRTGYDAASFAYRADDAPDELEGEWLAGLTERLPEGASVLDLGCGCGIPAGRWLVERRFAVTGVDISPVQIQRAKKLVPEGRFVCADITEVDLPPASFDAIVSFYTIIHVPLEEQPGLFGRMRSWLLPGGWLMAIVGSGAWTGTEENWLDSGATMYWSHERTDTCLRWLADAGFAVAWNRFVPEGDGGHALILARANETEAPSKDPIMVHE
jgi:SAM-dependent methyltransferase